MPARPVGSAKRRPKRQARGANAAIQSWQRIRNGKPGHRYCLVSLTDDQVSEYADAGWTAVRWGKKEGEREYAGPHVLSGRETDREKGKEVHARGCLLMEISEERFREIEDYGPDGTTGLAFSDALEERIVNKDGYEDPMRGISRRFAHLEADQDHGHMEHHVTGD